MKLNWSISQDPLKIINFLFKFPFLIRHFNPSSHQVQESLDCSQSSAQTIYAPPKDNRPVFFCSLYPGPSRRNKESRPGNKFKSDWAPLTFWSVGEILRRQRKDSKEQIHLSFFLSFLLFRDRRHPQNGRNDALKLVQMALKTETHLKFNQQTTTRTMSAGGFLLRDLFSSFSPGVFYSWKFSLLFTSLSFPPYSHL